MRLFSATGKRLNVNNGMDTDNSKELNSSQKADENNASADSRDNHQPTADDKKRKLKVRYKKSMIDVAARAAAAGATDQEIAAILGCHFTTFYRWRQSHQDFDDAICDARKPADQEEAIARLERIEQLTEAWFIQWLETKGAIVEQMKYDNGLTGNFTKIRRGGPPDLELIKRMADGGRSQEEFRIVVEVAAPPDEEDDFGIEDDYEDWLSEDDE